MVLFGSNCIFLPRTSSSDIVYVMGVTWASASWSVSLMFPVVGGVRHCLNGLLSLLLDCGWRLLFRGVFLVPGCCCSLCLLCFVSGVSGVSCWISLTVFCMEVMWCVCCFVYYLAIFGFSSLVPCCVFYCVFSLVFLPLLGSIFSFVSWFELFFVLRMFGLVVSQGFWFSVCCGGFPGLSFSNDL